MLEGYIPDMPQTKSLPKIRIAALGVLTITLIILVRLYATTNSYILPTTPRTSPLITNPEILQDWLPSSAYTYTLNHIQAYLQDNAIRAASISVRNDNHSDSNGYAFILTLQPDNEILSVVTAISNAGGILSTAVTINGELQTDQLSSTRNSTAPNGSSVTTTFDGQDELINRGATVDQVNEFQAAVQRFAPSANNVVINTDTLNSLLGTDGNITYSFELSIDGTVYHARLTCIGVTQSTLTLADPTNEHGVFDSGLMDNNE